MSQNDLLDLFGQLNAEFGKGNDFCLCVNVFRYTTRTSINTSAIKGTVMKADWEFGIGEKLCSSLLSKDI